MSRKPAVFAFMVPGLMLLASLPVFAADASGFVRAEGCTYFSGYGMYLQQVDGKKLQTPIAFRIPQSYFWENSLNEWSNVAKEECSATNPCETVSAGEIRILRVHKRFSLLRRESTIRGLSGDFAIELTDGEKLEGSFQTELRKPVQKIICEWSAAAEAVTRNLPVDPASILRPGSSKERSAQI
jgi:hypothetical protein